MRQIGGTTVMKGGESKAEATSTDQRFRFFSDSEIQICFD
ncbi:unnamed protein product [Arabidopsis halleri]